MNLHLHIFSLLVQVFPAPSSSEPQFKAVPENHEVLVAQGKMQYEMMQIDSAMPRYGPCWREALSQLEHGCKNLDDDMQSRMALAFTNCFLAKVGMTTYPCSRSSHISDCLKNVDNNAFTSYSNFFTHTQNMCYFLQSQVWHEETEKTIQRLATNSAKVSRSIADSSRLQEDIIEKQQETLDYQRQLVENGSFLSQAIEVSKTNVKDMLDEFRSSTSEQRILIFEVFDRVSRLQNLVVSEVSWLYTVVFYGTCLLVIYLLTSARRTADARLWMFGVLSANFALERLICRWSLPDSRGSLVDDGVQLVYGRVWLVRHFSLAASAIILTAKAVMYRDYNVINNNLLQEIKKQNFEMRKQMESFQVGGRRPTVDNIDGPYGYTNMAGYHPDNEDTGFEGDEEEWSDDESDTDTKTDESFNPDDDEFNTAANSRDTSGHSTPVNKAIDSALEALSSSLPTSGLLPPTNIPTSGLLHNPQPLVARGLATPRKMAPTPEKVYNLRSRSRMSSPTVNPVVEKESPETFAAELKKQLGTSRRNYAKWRMKVRKDGDYFSDDDRS